MILNIFQLLGITIRADIPMGLDLSPSFWKSLVGLELDPVTDIKEADPLTYSYMKKIEMVSKYRQSGNVLSVTLFSVLHFSIPLKHVGENTIAVNNKTQKSLLLHKYTLLQ